jgi:hypothetical protein
MNIECGSGKAKIVAATACSVKLASCICLQLMAYSRLPFAVCLLPFAVCRFTFHDCRFTISRNFASTLVLYNERSENEY